MKLWALSDLHINHELNRQAIDHLAEHLDDWLILGGDCCETYQDLEWLLRSLQPKWAKLIWVPGNHELWTQSGDRCQARGENRYLALVDLCRAYGVLTPEDPYPRWPGSNEQLVIAPLFLLYDYSFGPPGLSREEVISWAAESGIRCADEQFLGCEPYPHPAAWCAARLEHTERRLQLLPDQARTVLINHFPLRNDLVRLFRIPRFSPWCGTRATESWHLRYRAKVVVSGHLHMRATDWRDGVRFEEVSLGYPRHWNQEKTINSYLREVLPGPVVDHNYADIHG
jgi:predicted phosphodiesterase